jgi:hypothetical protein
MKSRYPLVAAATIGIGAAIAFALPAGANVSVQSESPSVHTVTLGRSAKLDANGAVVFAPVKIACTPGSYTSLTVSVTENVGGKIASGVTGQQIRACTGKDQTLRIAVTPTNFPFRRGVAFGQARLTVCDYSCTDVADEHNIQITG